MGWKAPLKKTREWGLFAASATVLVVGIALTVAVWVGLTWLLRHHWPWQDAERTTAVAATQLDVTKVALSVVAGIGAAVALTVTYRRQRDIERGRFDERLAAAASQLGGQSAAERLAGVYTIAALADETTERRQQCVDLLCAYLRLEYEPGDGLLRTVTTETTAKPDANGNTVREERTYERLPNDRQVRMTIIATIKSHLQAKGSWIGCHFDFAGAVFDGGNFDDAHFAGGKVFFDHACFVGGNVSFDRAVFSGAEVYFNHTQFAGSIVYFDSARFLGGTVRFSDAQFTGGEVSFGEVDFGADLVNFKRVNFGGASVRFGGAKFRAAGVSFEEAKFAGGTVTFGSAGGPIAPAALRSVVSFKNATGIPGVLDLGDLQTRTREVIGRDGQPLIQAASPDPFA